MEQEESSRRGGGLEHIGKALERVTSSSGSEPSNQDQESQKKVGQWMEIDSQLQPTKAMNLRVCYQVIMYLKLWENRGVTGIVKGVTFVGGLVPTKDAGKEDYEQSCAVLGVEPGASLAEVEKVYRVKAQFAHPDTKQGEEAKKEAAERFKRIQKAYEYIKKVKGA